MDRFVYEHSLPPELFPVIISHVTTRNGLQNCTLVSKAWQKVAQPILFSSLTFASTYDVLGWNSRFQSSPHLLQYPDTLKIDELGFEDDSDEEDEEWSPVMPDLPNLKTLTMVNVNCYPGCLRVYMKFPGGKTVESLILDTCSFLSSDFIVLLSTMPLLKSLTLGEFATYRGGQDSPAQTKWPFSGKLEGRLVKFTSPPFTPKMLKSLEVYANHGHSHPATIRWLLTPIFDLSSLRRLVLNWNFGLQFDKEGYEHRFREPFPEMGKFFERVAPSLIDLTLICVTPRQDMSKDLWMS